MRNRSKAALIESPSAQGEQPRPYIDAERLGTLEIDYKVEIRRLIANVGPRSRFLEHRTKLRLGLRTAPVRGQVGDPDVRPK